jgi:hypothetical protein
LRQADEGEPLATDELKGIAEMLLSVASPDGDIPMLLLCYSPSTGKTFQILDLPRFEDKPYFQREVLPKRIKSVQATKAALIATVWTSGTSVGDPAFEKHLANGGRIAHWPGRGEAVSVIVVDQDGAATDLHSELVRHRGSAPTTSEWIERDALPSPLLRALRAGVHREYASRIRSRKPRASKR